jgi:hypothetical protein
MNDDLLQLHATGAALRAELDETEAGLASLEQGGKHRSGGGARGEFGDQYQPG